MLNIPGKNHKLMLFKDNKSFICCLAYIFNLIAKLMLKVLKAGSHKVTKGIIKQISTNKRETFEDTPQSVIA
jgi:hypothetical protein